MAKRRTLSVLSLLVALFLLGGCRYQQAKSAWRDVLALCGTVNAPPGAVFFGPSDQVGPGSVWRRTDGGAYHLRWTFVEFAKPSDAAKPVEVEKEGVCKAPHFTFERLNPSQLLTMTFGSVDGKLESDLDRAEKITVNLKGWSLDRVTAAPFGTMVLAHPAGSRFRKDFFRDDLLALVSGLRIKGFSIVLEYPAEDAAPLREKYKEISIKPGKRGAAFTGRWQSPTTLVVSAVNDIYIMGELSPVTESGAKIHFASTIPLVNVWAPEYEDPAEPLIGEVPGSK